MASEPCYCCWIKKCDVAIVPSGWTPNIPNNSLGTFNIWCCRQSETNYQHICCALILLIRYMSTIAYLRLATRSLSSCVSIWAHSQQCAAQQDVDKVIVLLDLGCVGDHWRVISFVVLHNSSDSFRITTSGSCTLPTKNSLGASIYFWYWKCKNDVRIVFSCTSGAKAEAEAESTSYK